ncbi:related to nuclear pore protein [Cephalotrichum gorgonifer]|uniref:Related to nuclear pore protein n=1 Tax=Cephalotrichum gorgonifer TaxID=2041049 RepID=A0AAE8MRZ8_9PEZI|nr:related to nuclear pore protein [Cephalotrichum gorgonifer]
MLPPTVEVDPRGDIKLRVAQADGGDDGDADSHADTDTDTDTDAGADPVTFLACSRALARASPVFARMLYGEFAESRHREGGEWMVDLPNDKAQPMRIFLDIAHGRFRDVPRVLSVDQLHELTVLTNYYDATAALIPWVDGWMSGIEEIVKDANAPMPKVLWITWELGRKDAFTTMSRRMLMESEGPGFMESGQVEDIQTPPDIIERIDAIRIQIFQSLLNIFQEMVDNLIVVDERVRWCRHHTWMGPHRCESMILGSMTFCLARAGLWPLPEARGVEYSVLGLHGKLTTLVIHDIGRASAGDKGVVDHGECNPRAYLLDLVQRVVRETPSPLTEFHVKYLDQQAKKLLH